jgi:uridine kinase
MDPESKPYIIGITGGSASGKTRFIRELGLLFNKDQICILSQDNYYKSMEHHTRDEEGQINYDLPECIDLDAFRKDIESIKKGETVKRQEYLFQHEVQLGGWVEFIPAPVIIVEGLFIFYEPDIFKQFDLKIFIEANEDIQLNRRIDRDTRERNIPLDFVYYQWHNHVMPAYLKYLLPHKEKADLVILNNSHFNNSLKVIEDHIRVVLSGGKAGI